MNLKNNTYDNQLNVSGNIMEKRFYKYLFTAVVLLYTIFIFRTMIVIEGKVYFTLVDDAMITMRYARHLADGNGITWNINETPIQGYSCNLWMGYMALLHFIPINSRFISLIVMITSLILLLLNIVVVKQIAQKTVLNEWTTPALSAILVAFYFPLVYWSLRGMETGLVCLLVNIAALFLLKLMDAFTLKRCSVLFGMLILLFILRIDTITQASILFSIAAIISIKQKKILHFTVIAIAGLIIIIFFLLFQQYYFNDIMPNTYYLKITGVTLFERLIVGVKFFLRESIPDIQLPVLVIIGGFLYMGRKIFNSKLLILFSLFLVQCAYSFYTGGDFAEDCVGGANRFIIQGISFLFIVFAAVVSRIVMANKSYNVLIISEITKKNLFLFIYICIAFVFCVNSKHWLQWGKLNAPMWRSDIESLILSININKGSTHNARIAVHAAGIIPYFTDRYTIDLLGKNDQHIAKGIPAAPFYPGHNKWNYEYSIIQLKPDIIVDEWGRFREWMENSLAYSLYKRLPNGIWIRKDSNDINPDFLVMGLKLPWMQNEL